MGDDSGLGKLSVCTEIAFAFSFSDKHRLLSKRRRGPSPREEVPRLYTVNGTLGRPRQTSGSQALRDPGAAPNAFANRQKTRGILLRLAVDRKAVQLPWND